MICPKYCQSNNWWRFRKILWPSQNIWTLSLELPSYAQIQNLSNCLRYKSVSMITISQFSRIFQMDFWRVFAVWSHCGSTTYCGFGVRRVLGGALVGMISSRCALYSLKQSAALSQQWICICGLELESKELNHFGVIADLFRQIGGQSSRFVLFCSF